jgi:tRNA pseudouridine65 synthase
MLLYRDEHLLVLDKPSGMLVHRGWAKDGPVALAIARELAGQHVHPVHRLDRGTSGVLLFALDPETVRRLQAAPLEKRYLALVRGVPPERGVIDHPIPNDEDGPRVPATTEFRLIASSPIERVALVDARPRTGRLHQIRRHLKHINHPVIGDANYGKGAINRDLRARYGLARLALHALEVGFAHPVTGVSLRIVAPLPPDLVEPLARLGLPVRFDDFEQPFEI